MNKRPTTKDSMPSFLVGTRASQLALIQTRQSIAKLKFLLPNCQFKIIEYSSPGDRDKHQSLLDSSPDFFTKDLDQAILAQEIDCAIHSAKDLSPDFIENTANYDLDYFFLAWRAAPEDAIVLSPHIKNLAEVQTVAYSSARRREYLQAKFPHAKALSIRGNIHERLALLDSGKLDLVLMARAALQRLNLEKRIYKVLSLDELPTPEGQGALALSFHKDNRNFKLLRQLFSKAPILAGAGPGDPAAMTLALLAAVSKADLCLHDSLVSQACLDYLTDYAKKHRDKTRVKIKFVNVGKRANSSSTEEIKLGQAKRQELLLQQLGTAYRKGLQVLRLHGGDSLLFSRISAEQSYLEKSLIYPIILPAISAYQSACAHLQISPTQRKISAEAAGSRGLTLLSPRKERSSRGHQFDSSELLRLPRVYYMARMVLEQTVQSLLAEGYPETTPSILIFAIGRPTEQSYFAPLKDISALNNKIATKEPALFMLGNVFKLRPSVGLLAGKRVLLTCSEGLQEKAQYFVRNFGGQALAMPLIKMDTIYAEDFWDEFASSQYLLFGSPSGAQAFLDLVQHFRWDIRRLPKVMACGLGTAAVLAQNHIFADEVPATDYGSAGILKLCKKLHVKSAYYLCSDRIDSQVKKVLLAANIATKTKVIYTNRALEVASLPDFDAVLLASPSAVQSFISSFGAAALANKKLLVLGLPTVKMLESYKDYHFDIIRGQLPDIEHAIEALAASELKNLLV